MLHGTRLVMYLISKYDILKVIVPPLLASTLFVIALFGLALPMTKHNLLEQKKETITLLTQAAVNVLKYYEKRVQSGELSLEEAQRRAVNQVRGLRYGGEDKDYFFRFSPDAYAVGIDILLYAMSH